ncbi:hypothetical protein [Haloplasma contractile]|uniref:Uncharacterized protein n=1 Tax=Haloplasma contractile SSD-17B TaxID=1033810 RepID=U2FG44_9MOLU|nr:hypothetical protein [Haloplasma contractile]ERJ11865.1 hypothetical protein HLPCO_002105 [Haloplasma contractile SSD-17B]
MNKKRNMLINILMPIIWFAIIGVITDNIEFTNQSLAVLSLIYIVIYLSFPILKRTIVTPIIELKLIKKSTHRRLILDSLFIISLFGTVILSDISYNSTAFIIKQFLLFIVMSVFFIYIALKIYTQFEKKALGLFKIRMIKGFIIVVTFVTVGLISKFQLSYLNNYVIPPLYGCSYYDDYNNLIYNSQYTGSCPELEDVNRIETDEGEVLTFNVSEHTITDASLSKQEEYKIESTVTYHYDSRGKVTYYEIETFYKLYRIQNNKTNLYEVTYDKRIVENTYQQKLVPADQTYEAYYSPTLHSIQTDYYKYYKIDFKSNEKFNPLLVKGLDPLSKVEYRSRLIKNTASDFAWEDWDYVIDVDRRDLIHGQVFEDLYNVYYSTDIPDQYTGQLYKGYIINNTSGFEQTTYIARDNDSVKKSYDAIKELVDVKSKVVIDGELIKRNEYKYRYYPSKTTYFYRKLYNKNYYSEQLFNGTAFINRQSCYLSSYVSYDRITIKEYLGFYNFTSLPSKETYGYKLEHYHTQKNDDGKYVSYDYYNGSNPRFNNKLSVPLYLLNNYALNLIKPSQPIPFVYQKNPVIFEDELLFSDEPFRYELRD